MRESGIEIEPLRPQRDRLESEGKTLAFVACDGRAIGLLAWADLPKPTSRQAVTELRRTGLEVYMISGDSSLTAAAIAQQVGIQPDHVMAPILPEGKAEAIASLQRSGHVVAMVGDGINDAPALAQADLGIALGTGTDVAIETGQIVLVSGDLLGVVRAIRLSRATLAKIRQNLFWAFFYNIATIPLAAFGVLHPIVAAAAMAASSVSVVSNSLLLRRKQLLNSIGG